MANILIIGSDSFIASQFYKEIESEVSVKLFTRQATGKPNEIVKDLFHISEKDFGAVDVVLNFAAIVHQPKLNDDKLYKKVNTDLPIHLAEEAKKAGIKHFIQMSTIAVYGNVNTIDINTPENPINIYGQSKLAADKALLEMQDENFKVSVIRPPMVYGGGLAPGNLQSLIRFSQKGIPMPFKGVNNQRDFIHVANLVSALKVVVENEIGGITIPTDKNSVSTEQIIQLIKKYSQSRVRQIAIPRIGHALLKKMVSTIYFKVFGNLIVKCNLASDFYTPTHTIEDGLKEMIDSI